jgi:polyisoprenoid-binding protein YceI
VPLTNLHRFIIKNPKREMKRNFLGIMFSFTILTLANSQVIYQTTQGRARFFSEAPLENIDAFTHEVKAAVNFSNGEMLFIVPVKSFVFEKELMRRHFNEQYLETHKYPEAKFSGKITDFNPIISYYEMPRTVRINGSLTIHGITREINETASLQLLNNQLQGNAVFNVNLKDYNIKIPRMLIKNIAETVEVTIEVKLDKSNS